MNSAVEKVFKSEKLTRDEAVEAVLAILDRKCESVDEIKTLAKFAEALAAGEEAAYALYRSVYRQRADSVLSPLKDKILECRELADIFAPVEMERKLERLIDEMLVESKIMEVDAA